MYIGGATTVRGYPEGDYLADIGYILNFEYLIPSYLIPESLQLPYAERPLRQQVQNVLFADFGYGRLRGASARETYSRNLLGIGGGLRVHLYRNIYARTEWAYALGNHPKTAQDRFRFHFRLQMEV